METQPVDYQPIVETDFSGGVNQLSAETNLPETFVEWLENVDPQLGGTLKTRAGYSLLGGRLPVRVTRVDSVFLSSRDSQVTLTLNLPADVVMIAPTPLYICGRVTATANPTTRGPWPDLGGRYFTSTYTSNNNTITFVIPFGDAWDCSFVDTKPELDVYGVQTTTPRENPNITLCEVLELEGERRPILVVDGYTYALRKQDIVVSLRSHVTLASEHDLGLMPGLISLRNFPTGDGYEKMYFAADTVDYNAVTVTRAENEWSFPATTTRGNVASLVGLTASLTGNSPVRISAARLSAGKVFLTLEGVTTQRDTAQLAVTSAWLFFSTDLQLPVPGDQFHISTEFGAESLPVVDVGDRRCVVPMPVPIKLSSLDMQLRRVVFSPDTNNPGIVAGDVVSSPEDPSFSSEVLTVAPGSVDYVRVTSWSYVSDDHISIQATGSLDVFSPGRLFELIGLPMVSGLYETKTSSKENGVLSISAQAKHGRPIPRTLSPTQSSGSISILSAIFSRSIPAVEKLSVPYRWERIFGLDSLPAGIASTTAGNRLFLTGSIPPLILEESDTRKAGLPVWQAIAWIAPTQGSVVLGRSWTVTVNGNMIDMPTASHGLEVGNTVAIGNALLRVTAVSDKVVTVGRTNQTIPMPQGQQTLTKAGTFRYYARLRSIDRLGKETIGAALGASQSAQLVGDQGALIYIQPPPACLLPETCDVYVDIFRSITDAAENHYRVATVLINGKTSIIPVTDSLDDAILATGDTDALSAAIRATYGLPTNKVAQQIAPPQQAAATCTHNNCLVLGNITAFPRSQVCWPDKLPGIFTLQISVAGRTNRLLCDNGTVSDDVGTSLPISEVDIDIKNAKRLAWRKISARINAWATTNNLPVGAIVSGEVLHLYGQKEFTLKVETAESADVQVGDDVFINLGQSGGSTPVQTVNGKRFPSRIAFSAQGYPEVFWAPDGSPWNWEQEAVGVCDVNPADGDEITAITSFFGTSVSAQSRLSSFLLVFKRRSIYAVTLSQEGHTVQPIDSAGLGVNSQDEIHSAPDGVIFGSHGGLWLLDKSLQMTPRGVPMRRILSSWTGKVLISKGVAPSRQLRVTIGPRTLVMDLEAHALTNKESWTCHNYGHDIRMWRALPWTSFVAADGVYILDGSEDDNGQAIDQLVALRPQACGVSIRKRWERLVLTFRSTFSVPTLKLRWNGEPPELQSGTQTCSDLATAKTFDYNISKTAKWVSVAWESSTPQEFTSIEHWVRPEPV